MKNLPFILVVVLLAGCAPAMVSKKHRLDFQTTIDNSNKSILILEPTVISYKINDSSKENHEASKRIKDILIDAIIMVLGQKGYRAVIISADDIVDTEVMMLKNETEKKSNLYIQNSKLVLPEDATKLDDNFGESAIKLGKIFNTDLILGVKYSSVFKFDGSPNALNGLLFIAIDAMAKSGITKQEEYSCSVVLIDTKTGNVIYSNSLRNQRRGVFGVSEKELFAPSYKDQVVQLVEWTLP